MTADQPAILARFTRWLSIRHASVLAGGLFIGAIAAFEIAPRFGVGVLPSLMGFPLPAALDSHGARLILLFFVALFAVIAIAAAFMAVENREMHGWAEAEGQIVLSQPGFRTIRAIKGMPRNHRIADIRYVFAPPSAHGSPTRVEGSRIRIDEVIPEEEVEALLRRYPVGSRVRLFFDPLDPSRNVLEREADGGRTLKGLLALAVVFAMFALPAMWLMTNGAAALKTLPINRWGWVAILCALVSCGFFWGELRQRRWLAGLQGWPTARGVVVAAGVEVFDSGFRRRRMNGAYQEIVEQYMPVIEYRYVVDGVAHVSRNIQADMTIAGSHDFAEGYRQRYPVGAAVEVAYDPNDPARASLEPTNGFGWTFILAGSAFALVAMAAARGAWG